MTYQRAELRAFPRLSWAHPARLQTLEASQAAQIVDLSQGGCKLMPTDLVALIESGLKPGDAVRIEVGGRVLDGCVRWTTPNCSALGCAFDEPLSETDLLSLGLRISAAANSPPKSPPAPGRPEAVLLAS